MKKAKIVVIMLIACSVIFAGYIYWSSQIEKDYISIDDFEKIKRIEIEVPERNKAVGFLYRVYTNTEVDLDVNHVSMIAKRDDKFHAPWEDSLKSGSGYVEIYLVPAPYEKGVRFFLLSYTSDELRTCVDFTYEHAVVHATVVDRGKNITTGSLWYDFEGMYEELVSPQTTKPIKLKVKIIR